MNRYLYHFGAVWLLAVLAPLFTLAIAVLGSGAGGPPAQSPVSPVMALPWAPPPEPVSRLDRILDKAYWTSPLPWAAIGVVLFSVIAGVLTRGLRRAQPANSERGDHPHPPDQVPPRPTKRAP